MNIILKGKEDINLYEARHKLLMSITMRWMDIVDVDIDCGWISTI